MSSRQRSTVLGRSTPRTRVPGDGGGQKREPVVSTSRSKQPRRTRMADEGNDLANGPSTSKGKKRLAPVPSPRSPQIKRKRMPAEYYQSDVVDAISKQSTRTPTSDKEVFFQKNTFLAVRTENGKFFVCKTAQNVYQTTKLFKIIWLELLTAPGTYEMSYRDTIDIDSVLTDVAMNRQAGGLLVLPRGEIARVEQILKLAIKKENGTLDVDKGPRFREMKDVKREQDDDEDDDDDDDFEDEEEETNKPSTSSQTKKPAKKAEKASPKKPNPKAKAMTRTSGRPKRRGRPKTTAVNKTAANKIAKKITAKAKSTKGKAVVPKSAKRGRKSLIRDKKPAKVKAKKKKVKAEKVKKEKKPKVKLHPNDKLTPNTSIDVVTKDPMFEIKNESEIPEVSKYMQCKRSIRAVLTNDMPLLKKLIENKEIPSMFLQRSANVKLTALNYAALLDNQAALKLLIPELRGSRTRAKLPTVIMEYEASGRYNFKSLGHAVRAINIGRGSREGNNAFMKEDRKSAGGNDYIDNAVSAGVSTKTMDVIIATDEKANVGGDIISAVLAGHRKLAGGLIEKFNKSGGLNFNKLHEEVLLVDKPEDISPFRSVSVKKKPYDNDRVTPLHCAAINPNPKILAKLLASCPEYTLSDQRGRKPIHYAAVCEGSGPLELLLGRGINPDQTDNQLMTPLMMASFYGRQQNIEVLLRKIEADGKIDEPCGVIRKSRSAEYAIHYAVKAGRVECVKSLIKHGADLEVITSATTNKLTPLMLAAEQGHFQVAKTLIEAKAIITKRDKIKRTALMLACINGHYPIVTLLLRKGDDPNAKDSSGNTPVHYAAAYGWWHCLKILLKAGGDPNIFNDWKVPPLGVALMKGHTGCADLILEQPSVNLDFRDDTGGTLTMLTAASPMTEFMVEQMKYLIGKKAGIKLVDIDNRNALHYLAAAGILTGWRFPDEAIQKKGIMEVAKLLMDNGCDATVKDKDGNTPVNLALQQTNFSIELVQFLLNNGCTLSLNKAEGGDNALHVMAEHCIHNDLSALLPVIAKTCAKQVAEVPMEVDDVSGDEGKKQRVTTLEDAARAVDKEGRTPLLRCVIKNCTQAGGKISENVLSMLKVLIDIAKSDVNAVVKTGKDSTSLETKAPRRVARRGRADFNDGDEEKKLPHDGSSSLHILAVADYVPALTILLKAKPQLDILDKDGFTPLHRAILKKKIEAVKLLIDAGANVNLCTADKNGDKATPLILAARISLHDIIPVLVAKGAKVTAKDGKEEKTALHYVTMAGGNVSNALESTRILLQAGAIVNATDAKQRSPLHYSVNADKGSADMTTEVPEFLIEKKANVFIKDIRGRLPLHYAFVKMKNHRDKTQTDPIEIVNVLLDAMKGQQIDLQDKFGQTPLHWAAYRGSTVSAVHLAERVKDYNIKDNNNNTPLAMAALSGNDSVAIMLIQKGANINTTVTFVPPELENKTTTESKTHFWQWKPLIKPPITTLKASFFQAVVTEGWQGVIYLMMDRLQKFGLSFVNVIQAVLEAQKFQLARTLIRKQRDAKKLLQSNRRARTLLHLLSMHAVSAEWSNVYEQIASSMFERGAKLFARDDNGCTPLHYAAANQNAALCKLFAEKDANGFKSCLNCADHRGRTPVSALFWNHHFDTSTEEVIRLILKFGGSLNVCAALPNVESSSPNHMKQADSLEAWYHSPPERSANRTPLIHCIHMEEFKACTFLLKNGASCNYADDKGMTPLMHAIVLNELSFVKLLLNHDFNLEKETQDGKPKKTQESLSAWATSVWEQKRSRTVDDSDVACQQVSYQEKNDSEEDDGDEDEEDDDDEGSEPEEDGEDAEKKAKHDSDVGCEAEMDEDNVDDDDDDDDEEEPEPEDNDGDDEKKTKKLAEQKAKQATKAKLLNFTKTSDLDLNCVDSLGRTAVHHAAKTFSYGTYQNTEMVKLLSRLGAKTTAKDNQGKTPLEYCMETRSRRMAVTLQELQGVAKAKCVFPKPVCHTWTDGITFTTPKPDFEADARAMLEQLESKKPRDAVEDTKKIPAKVDDSSGMTEGGVVLVDTEQDIPYSLTLTKVDVKYGHYGMNNFYIMQIIHQRGKDMMLLFTRWGRIGEEGQFQKTPFSTKEEAIKEFLKIFKSKTGNDWSKVKGFKKEHGKYMLVREDPWRAKRKKAIEEFKFNLDSTVPSILPPTLQAAIKELIKPELLKKALSESGVDTSLIDLGNFIARDTLHKGKEILDKISDLLEKVDINEPQNVDEEYQKNLEEACELSNQYFELIPNENFAYDKIEPLTDMDKLNRYVKRLNILLDLSTTNMILLGAQYRVKEINPLDYIYRSLGCQIRLMKEDDVETQLLLQYIHNTSTTKTNVAAIFRVSVEGEEDELNASGLDNHKLLWHGSSCSNIISILKKGLLISPPEAARSGMRYGRGIYTSDAFAKSLAYCNDYFQQSDTKFMFLCEVALGKMAINPDDIAQVMKDGFNSVLGLGQHKYVYSRDILTPSGAVVPLGKFVNNTWSYRSFFDFNEYIVYKESQVCLRYVVQCKDYLTAGSKYQRRIQPH